MDPNRKTDRRQFLKGKSALRLTRDVLSQPLESPDSTSNAAADSQPGSNSKEPRPPIGINLLTFSQNLMGCEFEFTFNQNQYPQAADTAMTMFERIAELEAEMTIYDSESAISRLNNSPAGTRVEVSADLFHCLELAQQISHNTNGAFDISSGPLSKVWGFDQRRPAVPEKQAAAAALAKVNFRHVLLDPKSSTVLLEKPGMKINLGGIGKGYALDECSRMAREQGVTNVMIQGGQSSVVALGDQANLAEGERGWRVGISHPQHSETRLEELLLDNLCLSTSGSSRQAFFHQGTKLSHIIDPRTGRPAENHISSTVVTNSAASTDALATAVCLMTETEVMELCQQNPGISILLATQNDHRVELKSYGDFFTAAKS